MLDFLPLSVPLRKQTSWTAGGLGCHADPEPEYRLLLCLRSSATWIGSGIFRGCTDLLANVRRTPGILEMASWICHSARRGRAYTLLRDSHCAAVCHRRTCHSNPVENSSMAEVVRPRAAPSIRRTCISAFDKVLSDEFGHAILVAVSAEYHSPD